MSPSPVVCTPVSLRTAIQQGPRSLANAVHPGGRGEDSSTHHAAERVPSSLHRGRSQAHGTPWFAVTGGFEPPSVPVDWTARSVVLRDKVPVFPGRQAGFGRSLPLPVEEGFRPRTPSRTDCDSQTHDPRYPLLAVCHVVGVGLEPTTSSLRGWRASNCSIPPCPGIEAPVSAARPATWIPGILLPCCLAVLLRTTVPGTITV